MWILHQVQMQNKLMKRKKRKKNKGKAKKKGKDETLKIFIEKQTSFMIGLIN